MNNDRLIIEEKTRAIGDFLVGRYLPTREKRAVGPFVFLDRMGPITLSPGKYFDVDQHPHIGLCTLTYLIDGEIQHKDSTGADQTVRPGDVALMSSGRGVAHTERTPDLLRNGQSPLSMHGYQIWLALPKEKEDMLPRFDFVHSSDLPSIQSGKNTIKLVAGEALNMKSPLPVHSPMHLLDISAVDGGEISSLKDIAGESAYLIVEGGLEISGEKVGVGNMVIPDSKDCEAVKFLPGSRVIVFGGEPLPEKRLLFWNFVSSDRNKIEEAKKLWADKKFPKVAGDDTYIPLPE